MKSLKTLHIVSECFLTITNLTWYISNNVLEISFVIEFIAIYVSRAYIEPLCQNSNFPTGMEKRSSGNACFSMRFDSDASECIQEKIPCFDGPSRKYYDHVCLCSHQTLAMVVFLCPVWYISLPYPPLLSIYLSIYLFFVFYMISIKCD